MRQVPGNKPPKYCWKDGTELDHGVDTYNNIRYDIYSGQEDKETTKHYYLNCRKCNVRWLYIELGISSSWVEVT